MQNKVNVQGYVGILEALGKVAEAAQQVHFGYVNAVRKAFQLPPLTYEEYLETARFMASQMAYEAEIPESIHRADEARAYTCSQKPMGIGVAGLFGTPRRIHLSGLKMTTAKRCPLSARKNLK